MFITGVNDTGDKLFTGVNDTGDQFLSQISVIAGVIDNDTGEQLSPVTTTPAIKVAGDNDADDQGVLPSKYSIPVLLVSSEELALPATGLPSTCQET